MLIFVTMKRLRQDSHISSIVFNIVVNMLTILVVRQRRMIKLVVLSLIWLMVELPFSSMEMTWLFS